MDLTQQEERLITRLRDAQDDLTRADTFFIVHLIPLDEDYVLQTLEAQRLPSTAIPFDLFEMFKITKKWLAGEQATFLLNVDDLGFQLLRGG